MKKSKNIWVIVILAILAVAYYLYLSNRPATHSQNQISTSTKIESVLTKDSSKVLNTPKSSVKFYSEILECLYNENPTQEEIAELGKKAREIFDLELINNNPEDIHLSLLSTEIDEYADAKRIILSYVVESSDQTQYYTKEEKEYASVNASYTLRETKDFTKANEEYILRKDENGQWKILGWRVASQEVLPDQNNNE